jgi:uncharacterized coiled-coil protein SlyX
MNIEQVQKRLEELQAQAKQQEAVLLQISGAIQDCQFWLGEMSKEKANAVDQVNDTQGNE